MPKNPERPKIDWSSVKTSRSGAPPVVWIALALLCFSLAGYIAWQIFDSMNSAKSQQNEAQSNLNLLEKMASEIIKIDPSQLNPSMEGRQVFVNASAQASQPLQEPVFGIRRDAISMKRTVSHWGTSVSHSSERVWERSFERYVTEKKTKKIDEWQPSQSKTLLITTGGENPLPTQLEWTTASPSLPIVTTLQITDENIRIGAYSLDKSFVRALVSNSINFKPVKLDQSDYEQIPSELTRHFLLREGSLLRPYLMYTGKDISKRGIGDEQVAFSAIPASMVSVIATVKGDRLEILPKAGAAIAIGNLSALDLLRKNRSDPIYHSDAANWLDQVKKTPIDSILRLINLYPERIAPMVGFIAAGFLFIFFFLITRPKTSHKEDRQ